MTPTGSVDVRCEIRAGRSALTSIRCSGLSRTSRPFDEDGGAVRLMLATLGPGVLAGDRFDVRGRVLERAALIATGQMATPVFPGITPAQAHATWTVAAGAVLCALTEPLLLEAGSRYAGRIDVDLEPGGIAILAETTAFRGPAQLSSRLTARIAGTPVLRDALERSGDAGDAAVGTIAIVSDESAFRAAVAEELRAYAANANRARIGWGETTAALMVRLTGTVWNVHACVREIAAAARRLSAAPQS